MSTTKPATMERDAEIARAYLAGETDTAALSARFRITDRSICRALIRAGVREPQRKRPANRREEVLALMSDGMPANWAAETVGMNYEAVSKIAKALPQRREFVSEWGEVWGAIRNSSALLEWHYQFAPRG